eukprot:scaffold34581_cov174-Skeletonema_dohrnii-CCMP3373.AAC.1
MEFANEESVDWKMGDDALEEMRGSKCKCVDDEDFFEERFKDCHDSKRMRIMKHTKGGSFDLLAIKVSSNLISKLMPGQ